MHSASAKASHWYWPLNLSEFHCCSITQRKIMTAHLSYKEPNTATEASLKALAFAQELKDSPIGIFSFLYMGIYHICIICRDSKPKVWASPQQQEPAAVWPSSFPKPVSLVIALVCCVSSDKMSTHIKFIWHKRLNVVDRTEEVGWLRQNRSSCWDRTGNRNLNNRIFDVMPGMGKKVQ